MELRPSWKCIGAGWRWEDQTSLENPADAAVIVHSMLKLSPSFTVVSQPNKVASVFSRNCLFTFCKKSQPCKKNFRPKKASELFAIHLAIISGHAKTSLAKLLFSEKLLLMFIFFATCPSFCTVSFVKDEKYQWQAVLFLWATAQIFESFQIAKCPSWLGPS